MSTAAELTSALLAAQSNGADDIIRVVQGTYKGSFIYVSTEAFNLTIEGGYVAGCAARMIDPANTVLDAMRAGTVLVFSTDQSGDFVVDGLTLRNGLATIGDGGGLFASGNGGDFTLTNNVINGNAAKRNGPGVSAAGFFTVTMTNNTIIGNTGAPFGGGYGGGVFVEAANTVSIVNNSIGKNTVGLAGAGIAVVGVTTVTLTNNTITGNTDAFASGGGVYVFSVSTVTLVNNVISRNSAFTQGGGVEISGSSGTITVTNNTISDNTAPTLDGGGIRLLLSFEHQLAVIYNNIIWDNSSPRGADIFLDNDRDIDFFPSSVNRLNNDFDQSAREIFMRLPFPIDPSNLDNKDPLFVDARAGNYHLRVGSPVINKGDNQVPGIPETDRDGHPRIFDGVVDMGAFEFTGQGEQPDIEVKPSAVNFGTIKVGKSKTKSFRVRNGGTADLMVAEIRDIQPPFKLEGPQLPFTVEPGDEVEVELNFSLTQTGRVQQTMRIISNDPDEPEVPVTLTGKGRR